MNLGLSGEPPFLQTCRHLSLGHNQKDTPCEDVFSIAFPLSGGAWRIRTAVDCFADR